MNNSQLIVYTFKEALCCCCHVFDSLVACSSNKALLIWDVAQGTILAQYPFQTETAPISITSINSDERGATLLLQLKETKVLIFNFDRSNRSIIKSSQYQLEMIGFTKLSLFTYQYDSQRRCQKNIGSTFLTIRYNNFIQRRSLLSGKLEQLIEADEARFEEISVLLTYKVEGVTYFLVVQEGATLKQFKISPQQQVIQINKQLKIQGKSQVNIVLSVEPTSQYKAYSCVRNGSLYLIDLKQMQVLQQFSISAYRIIKSIPQSKGQMFAIASKNEIGILQDHHIKSQQRIQKGFILDIDTFQSGVIGVTQQGKILFLPLL